MLGPDHPDTLNSLSGLATLYRKQGRLDEAFPLAEEAYRARLRVLGPDHFVLSYSRHSLGVILRLLGRPEEALPYARAAFEERRSRLGDAHRETRQSRLSLARLEGDTEVERELVEAGVEE